MWTTYFYEQRTNKRIYQYIRSKRNPFGENRRRETHDYLALRKGPKRDCEMPWNPVSFYATKCFLLNVIEGAKRKIGWEFLDYRPNEELLFPCFDQFYHLISNVDTNMLNPTTTLNWLKDCMETPKDPVMCGYPCCQKHPVFLTIFGCYLCNN